MILFIRSIPFLCHEALLNVRRHGLMTLAVIGTVTVTLCILGAFAAIAWQFHQVTDRLPRQFEVHAFMQPGLTPDDVQRTRAEIAGLPGVRAVTLVTREEAWADFKLRRSGMATDFEGLENPLGDKLEVQVTSPEKTFGVAARIRGLPGVHRVLDGSEVLARLLAINRFIRLASLILGGLLALGTVAIVSNAIRITLFARRREIRVMQLVGATNGFVRLPFLLEGMFDGLVGGGIACALLYGSYRYLTRSVLPRFPFANEVQIGLNLPLCLAAIAAAGLFIGLFGSSVSIRRFLRI
jgi:cell division transport system permease protein